MLVELSGPRKFQVELDVFDAANWNSTLEDPVPGVPCHIMELKFAPPLGFPVEVPVSNTAETSSPICARGHAEVVNPADMAPRPVPAEFVA